MGTLLCDEIGILKNFMKQELKESSMMIETKSLMGSDRLTTVG